MPKVTSLGHLGFYVRDMERSVAFYRDILGLQVSDVRLAEVPAAAGRPRGRRVENG